MNKMEELAGKFAQAQRPVPYSTVRFVSDITDFYYTVVKIGISS